MKQGVLALGIGNTNYAKELLSDTCAKLHARNKRIPRRVAGETFRQNQSQPLACDIDGESHIKSADSCAFWKKQYMPNTKGKSPVSVFTNHSYERP